MLSQLTRKLLILTSLISICFVIEAFPQGRNNNPAQPKVTGKTFVQGNTNRPTPSPAPAPAPRRRAFNLQIEVTVADSSEKVDGEMVELTSRENGQRFSRRERTNREGMARFSQVPQGLVRIQMVVRQFETFGQDYTLSDDNQTIRITLKKQNP